MSRFVLYYGDLRPSDSYLASHPEFHYDSDDWFDDDYDIEDDDEIMYMSRTCDVCGRTFTLYDAMSEYAGREPGLSYLPEFDGSLCGHCAADKTDEEYGR